MTQYPLYGRLDGPQGLSGQVPEISSFSGIWSPYHPAHSTFGSYAQFNWFVYSSQVFSCHILSFSIVIWWNLCAHCFLHSAVSPVIYRFTKTLALLWWHSHTPHCPFVTIVCRVSHIKVRETGCLAGYLAKIDLHRTKVADAYVKEATFYQRKLWAVTFFMIRLMIVCIICKMHIFLNLVMAFIEVFYQPGKWNGLIHQARI